jgi:hypothetical protein
MAAIILKTIQQLTLNFLDLAGAALGLLIGLEAGKD